MTIDERLEKLAAHHEALTQTVEILGKMQQKTEREIRQLGRLVRVIVADHEGRLLRLEGEEPDNGQSEPKP
jgi:hypothetical protein